jgi:two-component system OmpR family sensor kinase
MTRPVSATTSDNLAEPFRAIAELDGAVAFILDYRSGALAYISASVLPMLGVGRDTIAAVFAARAAAGGASTGPLSALCAVMAERLPAPFNAGAPAIDFSDRPGAHGQLVRETTVQHRDGQLVPLAVTSALVQGSDGAPAQVVGSLRDLSARAAQAAAQKRFASMLNHDFRTPLSTIDGAIQRLESGAAKVDEPTRVRYRKIGAAVDRLIEMLDTYLSPDRLADIGQAARDDTLAPATLLAEGAARARAAGRAVQVDAGDLPAAIRCEPAGLRMALRVLVDNAIAYSPAGGAISVAGRRADGGIVLLVADAGPGVPEAEVEHIFAKHARGSNAAGVPGSGLGLYMARAVVDVHGGKLTMRNLPGGGAEFALWLPAKGGAGKSIAVTCGNSDNSVNH